MLLCQLRMRKKYLAIYFTTRLSFAFAYKDLTNRARSTLALILRRLYLLNNDSLQRYAWKFISVGNLFQFYLTAFYSF